MAVIRVELQTEDGGPFRTLSESDVQALPGDTVGLDAIGTAKSIDFGGMQNDDPGLTGFSTGPERGLVVGVSDLGTVLSDVASHVAFPSSAEAADWLAAEIISVTEQAQRLSSSMEETLAYVQDRLKAA